MYKTIFFVIFILGAVSMKGEIITYIKIDPRDCVNCVAYIEYILSIIVKLRYYLKKKSKKIYNLS